MNETVEQILNKYNPCSKEDYKNALKEILQEIILLGLDRTGFFEKAAFCEETTLRIMYGRDRFSEDLEFILLKPNPQFKADKYFSGLEKELKACLFPYPTSTEKYARVFAKKFEAEKRWLSVSLILDPGSEPYFFSGFLWSPLQTRVLS